MLSFKEKLQQLTKVKDQQLKEEILKIIWEHQFFKELWIQKLCARKNAPIIEVDVLEDLPQTQKELIAWRKVLEEGKLQDILKTCNFISKASKSKLLPAINTLINIIQSSVSFVLKLFKVKYSRIFNQFIDLFHQTVVIFNPGVDLNVKESKASIYSTLFIGKSAKSIYRSKLQQLKNGQLREEQLFNVFFKYVVKPCLNSKKSHFLLTAAEQLVLGTKDQAQILEKLKINLNNAVNLANVMITQGDMELVIGAVNDLIEQTKQQSQQLSDYKLTKEEKIQIYKTMQINRIKLLHFIENIKILTTEARLKIIDQHYLQKHLDQFIISHSTVVSNNQSLNFGNNIYDKSLNQEVHAAALMNHSNEVAKINLVRNAVLNLIKEMELLVQALIAQPAVNNIEQVQVEMKTTVQSIKERYNDLNVDLSDVVTSYEIKKLQSQTNDLLDFSQQSLIRYQHQIPQATLQPRMANS